MVLMAGDGIPVYGVAGRGRTGWTESGQDRMKPGSPDGLDTSYHVFFCQGEGRGFKSRRPLQRNQVSGPFEGR